MGCGPVVKLLTRLLAAAGVAALPPACSPSAPSAELSTRPKESALENSEPELKDSAPNLDNEPETTTTTTTTVLVTPAQADAPAIPEFVMPENTVPVDPLDWWRSQPGYNGSMPSGACGGDLPPCSVMNRESGGDPTAVSPLGYCSTGDTRCRGKWQWDETTWANFGGYAHANDAPESVQDEKARLVWAGGQGCSHWAAC